jgi:PadR family transcriptional regulator PadR
MVDDTNGTADLDAWRSQLAKGATELAVLAVLDRRERYGLEILEVLAGGEGLGISEGSIYPLLNRLQREGKLRSRWTEEEGSSHPRKYYGLSEEGSRLLEAMKEEWHRFSTRIGNFLEREVIP